ncbi:MAG: sulfite reductase flavoprotein subunit alpha, partial [Pseudomonadota bacterium]
PAGSPFTEEQRTYLNGLFAGLHALATAKDEEVVQTPLKVFFASQTGTAEALCKDLRKVSAAKGFAAELAELNATTPADLASARHVLFVAATHGEGEPTDNARSFYEALMAPDCAALPASLNFAVCGLGDSSYPHFNKAARDLDARLAELGATRVAELVACDVDYDSDYAAWRDGVFDAPAFAEAAGAASTAAPAEPPAPAFDKAHPFMGTLIEARRLSGPGSAKCVNHIEISLCGGGPDLAYEVGDALGVWPLNAFELVDAILEVTGFDGRAVVEIKAGPTTLRQALYSALDLTTLAPKTAEAWGVAPAEDTQILDVLRAGVANLTPQALADGLRPLQPRLYSISSSPKKHPGEVHLTIAEVHYRLNDFDRIGVASTFLGDRLAEGGSVGVYVQRTPHFHLPADDTRPLIMIGPGTGIAPFRAFLEEREMRGATAENWLFFGDQHAAEDDLYSDELTAWTESGLLSRLSLAWSRDGAEKVYVQHLMEAEGARFFEWLEAGAAIYVCGDASRMAADVDRAIHTIVAQHGQTDEAGAKAYVDGLKSAGRYQRDVY